MYFRLLYCFPLYTFFKLDISKFLLFALVLQNQKHVHHYQHSIFEFNIYVILPTEKKTLSGNILSKVSENLSEFPIFAELISRPPSSKFNKYTHDCKTFYKENFMSELNSQDWDKMLDLDKGNVTEAVDNYLQNINILEKDASLKNQINRDKVSTKILYNRRIACLN